MATLKCPDHITIALEWTPGSRFRLQSGALPRAPLIAGVSPSTMRTALVILVAAVLLACFAGYVVGYRAGIKQSPLREERQGEVLYALGMYQAAEATNWTKVQSFIDIQIVAFTRDYERQFGVPSGTNVFDRRFKNAKLIADRIEKLMVPVNSTPER